MNTLAVLLFAAALHCEPVIIECRCGMEPAVKYCCEGAATAWCRSCGELPYPLRRDCMHRRAKHRVKCPSKECPL